MTKQHQPCKCHTSLLYWIDPDDPEREVAGPDDGNTLPVYGICGQVTLSTFAPGHDAKLKSILQAQYAANQEYAFVDGALLYHADPMDVARERGWERFLRQHAEIQTAKAERRAAKAEARQQREMQRSADRDAKAEAKAQARQRRREAADEVLAARDAKKAAEAKTEPKAGFYPVRVKVGRWVYDGTITHHDVETNQYVVAYRNGKGADKSATVSADAIVEGLPS